MADAPDIAAAITPPPITAIAFAEPRNLTSRDVFRLFGRAWPFIRPYRRHLLVLFLMMIPALPVGLFALQMVRVLFDVVGHGQPLTAGEAWMLRVSAGSSREVILWHACIAAGIATAIGAPYGALMFGYVVWILQRISNLFRVNLYARLQELSLRFHSEEKIGDAIFRMFQDSAAIPKVIDGLVIEPIRFLPYAMANFVWLFMFNGAMGCIALILLPIDFAIAWFYGNHLRPAFRAAREAESLATSRIEETLSSIQAVKAFGQEQFESGRYATDNWNAFVAARHARLMFARYRVWNNTTRGIAYVAALYLGAREVLHGGTAGFARAAVSLGLFQGSLGVFAGMSGRMRQLANRWGSLQDVAIAMARVLEMIAMPPEEKLLSGARLPPSAPQSLAFEDVGFGYDPMAPVLSGVTFEARVGEITAIAGPSGSGKSTIIAMLLRFYQPSSGRIVLDGTPLPEFDLVAWRGFLSVALQENPLFTASVRDNVAYGRVDASEAEIATAIERAGLTDFVRSLPSGLATMLGEKGSKLSTGQAQRIGLARALLRDAPILMLDEPTSALDAATEARVMRGVREWIAEAPRRRMALVVTHRRTTAARADRSFRITAGKVEAENGLDAGDVPLSEVRDG
ncbi:MAG: ABC transporter ATP-binding protein [Candidatus Binataceae bacterium]